MRGTTICPLVMSGALVLCANTACSARHMRPYVIDRNFLLTCPPEPNAEWANVHYHELLFLCQKGDSDAVRCALLYFGSPHADVIGCACHDYRQELAQAARLLAWEDDAAFWQALKSLSPQTQARVLRYLDSTKLVDWDSDRNDYLAEHTPVRAIYVTLAPPGSNEDSHDE